MAGTGTLRDAFVDGLRETYDAEQQLLKALGKLANSATAPDLAKVLTTRRTETETHIHRLEEAFASIEARVGSKQCEGIGGILEEGEAILDEEYDDATMDACLISACQRAEHYQIARYGTLVAWAISLGLPKAASLLKQNLNAEQAANEELTQLAQGGVNAAGHDSGAEPSPTSKARSRGRA